MSKVRIVAADDHQLFLKAFTLLLQQLDVNSEFIIVGTASRIQELLQLLSTEKADILFLDLNMVDSDASQLIPKLKESYKTMRIICLSMYKEDKTIREAMRRGADGYLTKNSNPTEIVDAIFSVLEGNIFLGKDVRVTNPKVDEKTNASSGVNRFNAKYQLTKREKEILDLIAKGKSNKDMASILFISKDTVSVHRKNLMRKLNVNSITSLLKIAFDYNLI
jgi:DNA-binding NarL/FixJ family response regulator